MLFYHMRGQTEGADKETRLRDAWLFSIIGKE